MKTNKIMIRTMGAFEITQRTKDGMFNATELAKQWNKGKSTKRKDVSNFLDNTSTVEFLEALSDEENLNTRNLVIKNRGKYGGTWMHPFLFIDFAMWLNPKFKVKVIKFVHDQLIENRHLAGDNYLKLSASGVKLKGYNYSEIAIAINWIVFNTKGKELRQSATENQLKELNKIQTKLSFAIDMGYIDTYLKLMEEMRKMWTIKKNETPF